MQNQNVISLLFVPFRALLFVGIVWCLRDLARAFLFPHLLLAKGASGNRAPLIAIFSKWFVALTRVEFYVRRDWYWVLILSLCTLQIGLLPLGVVGPVQGERSALAILAIFTLTLASINLAWWRVAPLTGTARFLSVTNRSLLSIAVLTLILGYLGLIGMADLQTAILKSAISLNPIAIFGFICALAMVQLITVETASASEGWGAHHMAGNFIQIFWYALIVITFTGVTSTDSLIAFIEIVAKTAVLIVFCDGLRMFLPEPRGAIVTRLTLYLIIPFALIMVISLVFQGIR